MEVLGSCRLGVWSPQLEDVSRGCSWGFSEQVQCACAGTLFLWTWERAWTHVCSFHRCCPVFSKEGTCSQSVAAPVSAARLSHWTSSGGCRGDLWCFPGD